MKPVAVMSIFGTRPEATKMAPLIKELEKRENIKSVICVTAQHREMLDQAMELFKIKPDYDLDIMKQRQTLTSMMARALEGIERVITEVKPDIILVHGDTATTFAGSLAAYFNQVKVGHVEAGLRTYNKFEPFPEEMNRVLTDDIADIFFAPTELSKSNLLKENISPENIFITGNTAIDALAYTVSDNYTFELDELNKIDYKNRRVITMTAHRRENLGEPMENICKAVLRLVEENPDIEIVNPVHKNPAVREIVYGILGSKERIHLIEPLDMMEMHNLMKRSYFIMTDSGGIQEEAPSMKKPVLVLRNVTERPEGIEAGTLRLAGVNEKEIYQMATHLLNDEKEYNKMSSAKNPYGDGLASKRIADAIEYYFNLRNNKPENFK